MKNQPIDKVEADKKMDEFADELTKLAHEREFTLAYSISHTYGNGSLQSGMANIGDDCDIAEEMGLAISSMCTMFYDYMRKNGKEQMDALKTVFVYAQSGIAMGIEKVEITMNHAELK